LTAGHPTVETPGPYRHVAPGGEMAERSTRVDNGSAAERAELLAAVAKLRVTDIRDGLDWIGLHARGSVAPEIRPLYRARACGFARTLRHVPTQQVVPSMSPEEYTTWAYEYWYGKVMASDVYSAVGPGSFLVVDTCGTQTPAVGSLDSMIWAALGVQGVLTNGGARDTDEIIYQGVLPVWCRWVVQPMYQGRVEYGGHGMAVEIGGQLVRDGDLVVADGDGAVVVPIEVVDDVVQYAMQESENDRLARRKLFELHGIEPNESVEPQFDLPPHPYAVPLEFIDGLAERHRQSKESGARAVTTEEGSR
jgi:4-hydroxy-4-methyl-2-oxoglutarate aldolase